MRKDLPNGVNYFENSFHVLSPWKLAFGEIVEEEHGFHYSKRVNVIYSGYIPRQLNSQPALELNIETPFWKLNQKQWKTFKKRVIGFSSKVNFLPDITDESLEDIRARLRGDWRI